MLSEAKSYIQQTEDMRNQLQNLASQCERINNALHTIPSQTELLNEVRTFLHVLSEATRNEVTRGLEQVVTLCIHTVFGEDYNFKIKVTSKSNNPSVDFLVVDTSGEAPYELPPDYSFGGGMIDTIAIGLRFGLLKVLPVPPRGPIMLDEPAKMVSKDRAERVANMIKELALIFNKQIIMVTHSEEIMQTTDNCIIVHKDGDRSKVEMMGGGVVG